MKKFTYSLLLILAACGGGGGGGNNLPPVITPTCGTTVPTSGSFSLSFPFVDEVEPNGDISTANPTNLATLAVPEDRVGVVVRGNINDITDLVDTFSFTSSRTIPFFFKLCEDSCNIASGNDRDGNPDSLDTSVAYFDVLDASGMVIESTRTNISTENYTELCIEGGVITYIQVIANNTSNAPQDYWISAMETL